jgi:hypothetical protein
LTSIPTITQLSNASLVHVLALNNANSAATSLLYMLGLEALIAQSHYACGIGAPVDAFLIAMDQDSPYQSVNFHWFRQRHERFLYIDRIVTAREARGLGLGKALYADLFACAQEQDYPLVGCEVNFDPPNSVSDAFHKALGFKEAGRASIHDGEKMVRYLEKPV